jgi:hypothetical protein
MRGKVEPNRGEPLMFVPVYRTLLLALLVAASALVTPGGASAQAPERADPWPVASPGMISASAATQTSALSVPSEREILDTSGASDRGLGAPLLGAAVGLLAGAAAGAAIGQLVGPRDDVSDGCMFFCVPSGPSKGAAVGALVGPGIGAHLGNRSRGNAAATVGASVLGVAGGVVLGALIGSAAESTGLAVAVGVPIALGVPVVVQRATAR